MRLPTVEVRPSEKRTKDSTSHSASDSTFVTSEKRTTSEVGIPFP